jgi:mono/diheme cytochrome c family protein
MMRGRFTGGWLISAVIAALLVQAAPLNGQQESAADAQKSEESDAPAGATEKGQGEVAFQGDSELGQILFEGRCIMCHDPGTAETRATGPGLKGFWKKPAHTWPDGTRVAPDPAVLRKLIANGSNNKVMPAFGDTLSAEDIDNIIAYIRTF